MSKIYPGRGSGRAGGERIRPNQQQQQQQRYSQQSQRQANSADDIYWPSTFTILCSIPVIFILYHYIVKLFSKILWGTLTISVEVSGPRLDHPQSASEETLYQWLMEWMAKNIKNMENTTVMLNKKTGRLIRYPGLGITMFKYKGTWIKLERLQTDIRSNDVPYDKIILSFPSSRGTRTLLYELLEECKPSSKKKRTTRTVIYEVDPKSPTCWKPVASQGKKKRPLSTVMVDKTIKDTLINDISSFLEKSELYTDRGIPYKRGYLLHGPLGCGKTSLAKGIAAEFDYDICYLPLTSALVNDDNLTTLMNSTPDNCILLIEDLDIIMASGSKMISFENTHNSPAPVTLHGLLNALDGVISPSEEGKITIMTTSQVEKLDPALIRPGRVDLKVHLGFPNDDQLRAYFGSFFPESGKELKAEFKRSVRELGINLTIAQLQGLFLFSKGNPIDAMTNMEEYFQEQFLVSELEPNK